jgi:MarR family transcriptional regulator, lower aerobic nicotinate degradation pathway regulator
MQTKKLTSVPLLAPSGGDPWFGHLLNQSASRIRVQTAAAIEPLGITPPMLRALEAIGASEGVTQVQLGARTAMDRTTIVHVVDRFETLGYARRTRSAADRRSHALVLTERGEAALREARSLAREVEDIILSPLSLDERHMLLSLLQTIHQPSTCPEDRK